MRLRWNGSRFAVVRGAVSLALLGSAGCFAAKSQQLSCDDIYGPEDSSFDEILPLVTDQEKGCGGPSCHGPERQQHGLRLEEPELIYDEMKRRPDLFYAYLSSGEMPQDGTPWTPDQLKIFRSWYCNGAFPP